MESGYDARARGRGPEELAHLDDTKRAVHEAMATLSEDQREILQLRHFLELSYAEIAKRLNIPQGTVMSRLHGARKSLRKAIERGPAELVNI
jgi:RNA polymerase sigma-70 factor (ECF subfamily)